MAENEHLQKIGEHELGKHLESRGEDSGIEIDEEDLAESKENVKDLDSDELTDFLKEGSMSEIMGALGTLGDRAEEDEEALEKVVDHGISVEHPRRIQSKSSVRKLNELVDEDTNDEIVEKTTEKLTGIINHEESDTEAKKLSVEAMANLGKKNDKSRDKAVETFTELLKEDVKAKSFKGMDKDLKEATKDGLSELGEEDKVEEIEDLGSAMDKASGMMAGAARSSAIAYLAEVEGVEDNLSELGFDTDDLRELRSEDRAREFTIEDGFSTEERNEKVFDAMKKGTMLPGEYERVPLVEEEEGVLKASEEHPNVKKSTDPSADVGENLEMGGLKVRKHLRENENLGLEEDQSLEESLNLGETDMDLDEALGLSSEDSRNLGEIREDLEEIKGSELTRSEAEEIAFRKRESFWEGNEEIGEETGEEVEETGPV